MVAAVLVESIDGTAVTTVGPTIRDGALNVYSLSSAGYVVTNGIPETTVTANMVELYHKAHALYLPQTAYSQTSDPTAIVSNPLQTTNFSVSNSKIFAPNGSTYTARGVNVANWAAIGNGAVGDIGNGTANGTFLLQLLPKCNMVRLNCSLESAGIFDTFVTNMTNANCVVVFEYHLTNNSIPNPLTNTLSWYSSNAMYYKNNPYVWFGAINEPGNPTNSSVADMHKAIYNAVRAAGNSAPFMLSLDSPYQNLSPYANRYTSMTNVVWDFHYYGYALFRDLGYYEIDQTIINNNLASNIQLAQTGTGISSADGTIPLIVGEYGTSTSGDQPDVNGVQAVNAVHFANCSGATAWAWSAGTGDRVQQRGVLTNFGQCVKLFMAGTPPTMWDDSDNS